MLIFNLISYWIKWFLMTIVLQVSVSLLKKSLQCLVDIVNSETASLASVAMESIGHVGLRIPLSHHDPTSGEFDEVQISTCILIPILKGLTSTNFDWCRFHVDSVEGKAK